MVYFIVIILSLLFFRLSTRKETTKFIRYFCIGIAVAIPVIIGGLRDKTVGTDTTFYAEIIFKDAHRSHDLKKFVEYTAHAAPRAEPAYSVINYAVSRLSNNLNSILLVLQILTFFFLILAIYKSRYRRHIVPSMFIFYCYFYNNSLNLIRQMLATTLFMLAYVMYDNRKRVKAVTLFGLDFLFHKTSLFGGVLIIISNYFSNSTFKQKWTVFVGIMIFLSYFMFRLDDVIIVLSSIDLFSEYGAYTSEHQETSSNFTEIIVRLYIIIMVLFAYYKGAVNTRERDLYIFLLCIEIFFFFTSIYSQYLYRLGFYATALEIFYIPYILNKFKNRQHKLFFKFTVYGLILFEWYWLHIDHGIGATVNYSSKLLGI